MYKNRDFYFSAFLISRGCPLAGHSRENQTTTIFEFEETKLLKELVEKFKGSLIVSSLKLSCRYFALKYGMNEFNDVLRVYWKNSISKLFASDNGLDFAKYLMSSSEFKDDEDLETIIKYEIASINSIVSESAIEVQLIYHPEEMVNCLANLELFDNLKKNNYLVTIEPDFKKIDGINTVFHS